MVPDRQTYSLSILASQALDSQECKKCSVVEFRQFPASCVDNV
jgi:hypothetical protein